MKHLFLGCAAAAALADGALAHSGSEGDGSAGAAGSNGEVVLAELDTITVYATRSPIPAFDYPGQVSVIGKDVIDDFNPQTISDIFDAVPGARFDGGPRRAGETPSIRGLSGEGVLVLFDGARQSFLSGHDGRFFIDPDLVEAVEVVRGPTSALYGSGALGGVIALRTITASDFLDEGETAGVKISSGYQSVNDEWRVAGKSAWRSRDDRIDVVANLTYRQSEDIELGNGFSLPADDEIVSSLLKGTFRPARDLTVSASWIRFGGDSIDPNNPQGANIAEPGNENVDRDIDNNTVQGQIHYAPAGSKLIDLNLSGYFTRNEVRKDEIDSTRSLSRRVETIGMSLDNRSTFALGSHADLTFTYGAEFYRDEQIGRDNMSVDGTRGGVPDATSRFYGVFAQAELAFDRPFGAPGVVTIIPGVRWDRFENEAPGEVSTDDDAVSPKIGISYKPVEQLILFGNWSQAFRAQSFNEIYADGVHFQIPNFSVTPPDLVTKLFISNPDLVPEQSETWEVGAGIDFESVLFDGDILTAKASYFSTDATNLIDLEVSLPFTCFLTPDQVLPFFPPCGSGEAFGNFSRNVNIASADIEGFEMEAQYDSELIYVRANFSTIDGRDVDSGGFIGILSPDKFFIDAGMKLAGFDARIGARVTVASAFDKVNDPALARDRYAVGDIYAVWEPSFGPLKGLRVDLGVDNVADANYEVVAAGVSQPGRNYKAAISWRRGF